MPTTRQQILGWIKHCEREHPGKGTHIPSWLCSMDAVTEAEGDGFIEMIGLAPPCGAESVIIYGLTHKGRQDYYSNLPRAGQS